jgi:hypothetical protein
MTTATRMIVILTLLLTLVSALAAQETTTASTTTPATTTAAPATPPAGSQTSNDIHQEFSRLLRQHPPELATILGLDPTLLSNDAFLSGYPELSRFVTQHPEVRRNPRFYLSEFDSGDGRNNMMENFLTGLAVFSVFLILTLTFAWLVRTIIEQKRWSRLSQTQSEVHNKILDRFGASEEVLAYMRTPAGTKFLESAPIPLRAEQATQNAPVSRILWSVQLGVIVVAGALGLLFVSGRVSHEDAQALSALGVVAFSIGAGFIASAFVSLMMSKRLGLWQSQAAPPAEAFDDAGVR